MMCTFKHTWIAAGLVLSSTAFGCSDDSDDKQDGASVSVSTAGSGGSAKVDVATSQAALTELTGSVDTTVTGYKPAGPPPAPGATAEGGTVAVRCNPGGSAN